MLDSNPPSIPISVPQISPKSKETPTRDSQTDDAFPVAIDVAMDLVLDDEGLSPLEKIYLYSRSKASFHRIFIAHALPDYLHQITPQEAVEYVLPLLSGLAMDEDEKVREAFTAGLVPIIWWFFTNCQVIPDDLSLDEAYASSSTTVTISVQAFTPILGTLLLSPSGDVSKHSRTAVVKLLLRMQKIDDIEMGIYEDLSDADDQGGADFDPDDDIQPLVGLFRRDERLMFRQEILQQVVIGMGRLDVDLLETDDIHQSPYLSPGEQTRQTIHIEANELNPYFPAVLPQHSGADSPTSSYFGHSPQAVLHPSIPTAGHLPLPPQGLTVEVAAHRVGHFPHGDYEYDHKTYSEGGEDEQQAAVGRLSSMSLMAAVTASGSLSDETKLAFVKEVERVGRDPFSYVRCEASYVMGALAKVVPEEVVTMSLLPLFHSLQSDVNLHVRYSSVFALPAILSRLSPDHRRSLALETIVSLSSDENEIVRSGALEVLGEVVHTFQNDRTGPPKQLLHLFLGRGEDKRVRDGQQQTPPAEIDPLESFYRDPGRPLTCAFNFPAVALTLGASRWDELRDAYADVASNRSSKVRRTLAASLGKMAEIIGQKFAQRDLISVWWDAIRCEEEEVRTKIVESSDVLIGVVGEAAGMSLLQGLLTVWEEGVFKGWRERDAITKRLLTFAHMLGEAISSSISGLLLKALEDDVAAVRETAISMLPQVLSLFSPQADVSAALEVNLRKLAKSAMYRRRMTFVACQQARLLFVGDDGKAAAASDDLDFLMSVADLSNDVVEGVRIGVARFATIIYERLVRKSHPIPPILVKLVQRFSEDSSQEVQSYVPDLTRNVLTHSSDHGGLASRSTPTRPWAAEAATFSRPPPPRVR